MINLPRQRHLTAETGPSVDAVVVMCQHTVYITSVTEATQQGNLAEHLPLTALSSRLSNRASI